MGVCGGGGAKGILYINSWVLTEGELRQNGKNERQMNKNVEWRSYRNNHIFFWLNKSTQMTDYYLCVFVVRLPFQERISQTKKRKTLTRHRSRKVNEWGRKICWMWTGYDHSTEGCGDCSRRLCSFSTMISRTSLCVPKIRLGREIWNELCVSC